VVGHINHSLFWKNLAPAGEVGGKLPSGGSLEKALVKEFGSVEVFKKNMNAVTGAIQGSGWGWLVCSVFRRRLNGLLIYCSCITGI
jgi:Fe-Mn family superoxide dismutase